MNSLDQLIQSISKLPGLGKKSATRIAYHLLRSDEKIASQLGRLISTLKTTIRPCSNCGNYCEETYCDICKDSKRDKSMICVVESPQDILMIEASREFNGFYHVLHGVLAPLEGIGPDQLQIGSLEQKAKNSQLKEVILATNPTLEGDTTALYIKQVLQPYGVRLTRLALGLPVGGDLEYADRLTLARSLQGRHLI